MEYLFVTRFWREDLSNGRVEPFANIEIYILDQELKVTAKRFTDKCGVLRLKCDSPFITMIVMYENQLPELYEWYVNNMPIFVNRSNDLLELIKDAS